MLVPGQQADIQSRIRGIGEGSSTAVDADGNTADQVAASDSQTSPEQGEAGVVGLAVGGQPVIGVADLGGEDDGHDDAVDGDDLTEDDGDQVLGSDSRRLDTGTEDGRARDEDTPSRQESDGTRFRGVPRRMLGMGPYHAAPTTDRPMQSAMPRSAHAYGDTDSRKAPTYPDVRRGGGFSERWGSGRSVAIADVR